MATPTYTTVISQIDAYIVANGNNEITANVLNPILKVITDFANNTIGNLGTLTTTDTDTIVGAINSLKTAFDNLNNNGIQLLTGYNNPNVTPPPSYNYADFYMELDIMDNSPIQLWQWNGTEWKDSSGVPSTESDNVANNSTVIGITVSDALNTLSLSSLKVPKIQFIADGVLSTYDISVLAQITAVFWNGAILDDADWLQTGTEFTLTFTPAIGEIIKPI